MLEDGLTRIETLGAPRHLGKIGEPRLDLGGVAASLGMTGLAPLCRQLEHACRTGAPLAELAPRIVDPLWREMQRLSQALRQEFAGA